MKLNALVLIAGLIAPVFSAALSAEEICGDLGVMNMENLPEGVDPAHVRQCAGHPLRKLVPTGEIGISERDGVLARGMEKRACYRGNKNSGCDDGYCWKKCGGSGSGKWCWTAENNGAGDWIKCGNDGHCNTGQPCSAGICKDCGCSC